MSAPFTPFTPLTTTFADLAAARGASGSGVQVIPCWGSTGLMGGGGG
jgi:hypothetical protein